MSTRCAELGAQLAELGLYLPRPILPEERFVGDGTLWLVGPPGDVASGSLDDHSEAGRLAACST